MNEQKDLLVEHDLLQTPVQPALRFVNYLIDIIGFYVIMFIIVLLGAGIINPYNMGMLYLVAISVLIVYFTVMEGAAGGKTLGKYITKTRAVKEDGTAVSFKDAFLRTLCRLVPFEPLSIFGGRLWHDKWTKTTVIKEQVYQ